MYRPFTVHGILPRMRAATQTGAGLDEDFDGLCHLLMTLGMQARTSGLYKHAKLHSDGQTEQPPLGYARSNLWPVQACKTAQRWTNCFPQSLFLSRSVPRGSSSSASAAPASCNCKMNSHIHKHGHIDNTLVNIVSQAPWEAQIDPKDGQFDSSRHSQENAIMMLMMRVLFRLSLLRSAGRRPSRSLLPNH